MARLTQQVRIEEQNREERRTNATRRINATVAKLVAVERHGLVRQQLLEIIADAAGYRFALLSEMEEDEQHLRVVAAHMPQRIVKGAESLLGFQLIGHRVVNAPDIVLKTPPTEIFEHVYEWRPEIAKPISTALEFLMGIRQIVSIRLHTGDYYLGAVNFFATQRNTDIHLLEYLCNNHLVYAIRLIQEQAARERLQMLRTAELQQEIRVRQHAEEAIRLLYTITADQRMDFAQKVRALLEMGCRRFGMETGIFAHIRGDTYQIEEIISPILPLTKGEVCSLGNTFCADTLQASQPLSIEHTAQSNWHTHPCYHAFRMESYLGTAVHVQTAQSSYPYGTLSFSSTRPKATRFQPSDHEFLSLMAQWIGGEIERHHRTEQLQAYAAQLELTHSELAEAHDRALEASRLKSEFLATMSHEIRTPMNGIIGMTELLTTTGLNERQHYYASVVLKETDHLLRIINDILDFSKMEAGKLALGHEGFSPLTVVESVASLLTPQAIAKNLTVITYVAPEVPPVLYGDASRLRQILLNLVGNAIKFTDRGDVMVELCVKELTATEATLYSNVLDTGVGIEEEKLAFIFQPFTQVDGGVTRRHGGTGLGLAIASRLVTLMNGEIGVTSKVNEGSTFWFTAKFERPTPLRGETTISQFSLAGSRLFLVGSNQRQIEILQRYLTHWGAHVDRAADEQSAFDCLLDAAQREQPYHGVLVEQLASSIDTWHFAQRCKANPALQRVALIRLGNVASAEACAEVDTVGFDAHLTKPLRQFELHNTIQTLLNRPQATGGAPMNKNNPRSESVDGAKRSAVD